MSRPANCHSWGAGWDSTAAIIKHVWMDHPIDLITFADHGAEKRFPDKENGEEVGTYEFIEIFSDWLVAEGYPRPTICRYQPMAETNARYEQAVVDVIRALDLEREIDPARAKHLGGIYGNSVANETLPGLAFSMKSCSIKHKLAAQEPI